MEMHQIIPEVIVERRGENGQPSTSTLNRQKQQYECLSVLPTPDQSNLMKSIRYGKIEQVEMLLNGEVTMPTPFTNNMGVSYIGLAVKDGNTNMLEVFFKKARGEDVLLEIIDHAILYAIKYDMLDIVKYLLHKKRETTKKIDEKPELPPLGNNVVLDENNDKEKAKKDKMTQSTWRKKDRPIFDDAEFPIYMSPIVLACQLERRDILKLLLSKDDGGMGNQEIHPVSVPVGSCPVRGEGKDYKYKCEVCSGKKSGYDDIIQPLEDSLRTLEVYKALASPAYILNCGVEDPILECFKLRKVLLKLSRREQAFKAEYKDIAAQCSSFARELVSLCRDQNEVKTCLAYGKGIEDITSKPETIPWKRIAVALYYEEKDFIGHSQTQQFLQRSWVEGLWPCGRDRSEFFFYLFLVLQMIVMAIFFPILCLMFSFKVPCVYNFMKDPVNKYINDTISRLIFICLLMAEIEYPETHSTKLGCVFSILEVIIAIWVFGMWLRALKMMWRHGISRCFNKQKRGSGAYVAEVKVSQVSMLLCFLVWFICKLAAIPKMKADESTCAVVSKWPLELRIAESCYSIAVILALVALVHLFQESRFLGPLEISLSRMIIDILKFVVLFFVIFFAFVLGLTKLYSPYMDFTARYANGTKTERQADDLINVQSTFKTLFWSLFQYPDVFIGTNIVLNYTGASEDDYINSRHSFIEFIGFMIVAIYHIVAVIVLLNMLIAMMANSYNTIEYNADLEWKFARARLRTLYSTEIGSLPPPFNANPVGLIMKGIMRITKKTCYRKNWKTSQRSCCVLKKNQGDKIEDEDYKQLMERLCKRYWHKKSVAPVTDEVSDSEYSQQHSPSRSRINRRRAASANRL